MLPRPVTEKVFFYFSFTVISVNIMRPISLNESLNHSPTMSNRAQTFQLSYNRLSSVSGFCFDVTAPANWSGTWRISSNRKQVSKWSGTYCLRSQSAESSHEECCYTWSFPIAQLSKSWFAGCGITVCTALECCTQSQWKRYSPL
jgi:hypothetical protein